MCLCIFILSSKLCWSHFAASILECFSMFVFTDFSLKNSSGLVRLNEEYFMNQHFQLLLQILIRISVWALTGPIKCINMVWFEPLQLWLDAQNGVYVVLHISINSDQFCFPKEDFLQSMMLLLPHFTVGTLFSHSLFFSFYMYVKNAMLSDHNSYFYMFIVFFLWFETVLIMIFFYQFFHLSSRSQRLIMCLLATFSTSQ